MKHGIRDYRGGGRSSARETAVRVAAGAIAKRVLAEHHGVTVRAHLSQIGPIRLDRDAFDADEAERNAFFWPNAAQVPELEEYMKRLSKEGDSIGAKVEVRAIGAPPAGANRCSIAWTRTSRTR